jgi:hypothetical protein
MKINFSRSEVWTDWTPISDTLSKPLLAQGSSHDLETNAVGVEFSVEITRVLIQDWQSLSSKLAFFPPNENKHVDLLGSIRLNTRTAKA